MACLLLIAGIGSCISQGGTICHRSQAVHQQTSYQAVAQYAVTGTVRLKMACIRRGWRGHDEHAMQFRPTWAVIDARRLTSRCLLFVLLRSDDRRVAFRTRQSSVVVS